MKNILFLVFILSISCNSVSENRQINRSKAQNVISDSSDQPDTVAKTHEDAEEPSDCIFDQLTQTDEFLKNIKELQKYEWDYDTRTAT